MSDTERKLMEEHVRYWRALQERGIVLVYGPVFDVRGDWGMGNIETEDLLGLRSLQQTTRRSGPVFIRLK
jgi:uncharacterized protein YciI